MFLPRFDAREACALFEREHVTVTNLVPTMLQRMLAAAPSAGFAGGALRLVLSGGAPIAPATVRAVLETFRCEYVQTYGMTQTSPYLTLSLLHETLRALPTEQQFRLRAAGGDSEHPFAGPEFGYRLTNSGHLAGEFQTRNSFGKSGRGGVEALSLQDIGAV